MGKNDTELLRFVGLSPEKQKRRLQLLRDAIGENEDFRFGRVRLDSKKPRYELPDPTEQDPENTEFANSFECVVLLAKKNYYQSDEDKEAGREPKEKRMLILLRLGRYTPEIYYVSPTGVRNWQMLCKQVSDLGKGLPYFGALLKMSAEFVRGPKNSWSKPKFEVVRVLTDEELDHVQDLRDIVELKVGQWADDAELSKYEEAALSVDKGKGDDFEEVDEEREQRRGHARIEEDDEDEDEPKSKSKSKSDTRSKSKAKDEDEDEKPRKAASKKQEDDDDDEDEPKSKSKSRSKKQEDDDDDDLDEVKPSRSRKQDDDDEDEDEPKSKSKSRSKKQEDDDDDEDEPKSKSRSRGGHPQLDDDDDDD